MSVRLLKYLLLSSMLGMFAVVCSANDMKGRTSSPDAMALDGCIKRGECIDIFDEEWTPIEKLSIDITFLRGAIGVPERPYCPRLVSRPFIRLVNWQDKTYVKKIVWTARKPEGEVYKGGFSIYFSPDLPRSDNNTGIVGTWDVPLAFVTRLRNPGYDIEFKYTIIGDECPKEPLDPRMRVD